MERISFIVSALSVVVLFGTGLVSVVECAVAPAGVADSAIGQTICRQKRKATRVLLPVGSGMFTD
jgi:hypothetical protein